MGAIIGLIVAVVCAVVCVNLAKKKGKSVPLYGILGFLLGPIWLIVALVVKPSNQA
ncbi:MAG: hypothetical protein ACKO91_09670 [Acidimicrobiales bacterium]